MSVVKLVDPLESMAEMSVDWMVEMMAARMAGMKVPSKAAK